MRTHWYFVLTGWLALTPWLSAQPINPQGAVELPTYTVPERDAEIDELCDPGVAKSPTFYSSFEGLFWWTKSAQVNQAIVGSLGNPAADFTAFAGAGGLNDPNALVLYGPGEEIDYGLRYGIRANFQFAFDDMNSFVLDFGGMYLPQLTQTTQFNSPAGVPALSLLFNNVTAGFPGTQSALPVAGVVLGNNVTGGIEIDNYSEFWSGDINVVQRLVNRNSMLFGDLLVGFRHVGFYEGFVIHNNSSIGFSRDTIRTRSLFYGFQTGGRIGLQWDHFSVQVMNKFAVGATDTKQDLLSATATGGGFYVRGSNRGTARHAPFAWVNDTTVSLTWAFRPNIAVTGGYSFLYWSRMIRSAEQLDVNINGLAGTAPFNPAPRNEETSFWGMGGSVAIEFMF